jgi:predicted phage terminase large subunit-like protein
MDPDTKSSPALNAINQAVTELMADDSPYNALIVSMPAQEGKSTLCARRLPEWVLDREPDAQVAIVSYQDEMAIRWGREIKWDAAVAPPDTFRVHIRRDSSAAGRWDTQEGGGVYCTGVGGPLTGRSVGRLLVIDDPVKDRAAAESATIRQSTWDWWESVALTRFGSRTRVVLIMTRFHEDDLAGRILSRPSPLKWRQLRIPAVAETDDEIGRAPGEELASVRGREPGYFLNRRATMSPYVFAGMYQQTPTAPEGNFFRRASFRYWRPMPAWNDGRQRIDCEGTPVTLDDCWRFATVDVAASTRTSADFTVIAVWAVTPEGFLVLLDRARARVEMHDHFALLPPLAATWRFDQAYVEKVFYSSTFVKDAQAAGYAIAEVIADTDKVTRAIPAAGRIHAGRVWFPAEAPWLDEWCDELAIFPQGAHDDQVDTFSYAARVLVNEWTPGRTTGITRTAVTPFERSVAAAHHSATGDGKTDLDIMNVPF